VNFNDSGLKEKVWSIPKTLCSYGYGLVGEFHMSNGRGWRKG